jgi:hypothetical protein
MKTYRDMGVSSVSLGISGREDCVNKDKGANNLSTKAITLSVAMMHIVHSSKESLVWSLLETLDNSSTADGTKTLHHYVKESPDQGQLPCQEQTKSHSWVNVSSCFTIKEISQFLQVP